MSNALLQFHFLRPSLLLLLIPALLLVWWLTRRRGGTGSWEQVIAPALLVHLVEQSDRRGPRRWPVWLVAGWATAVVALAGPSWERLPQPVLQKRDALVIVLDLSLSMFATDVSPSRIQRARFKLQDLLDNRDEGLTGLVVYSADAHVVAPLTDDSATIANLLPALAPDIMPQYGSNPRAGIERALGLLHGAEASSGRILLVTDGITDGDVAAVRTLLDDSRWDLSILPVGTGAGGPVRLGEALLRDRAGEIVVPTLDRGPLEKLAAATGARLHDLQLDDRDLRYLVPAPLGNEEDWQESEREFDQWRDRGPLLVTLLLPIAALAARRGWLLLVPLVFLPLSPPAAAVEWRDLWSRPDQQGARLLAEEQPDAAAERFADPAWRGTAHYRAGEFEAAAQAFAEIESPEGLYNLGNALAQAGQLRQALAAYDAALASEPELEDARINRERVLDALRDQHQSEPGEPQDGPPDQQEEQDQQGQANPDAETGDDGGQTGDQAGQPGDDSASADGSDPLPDNGESMPADSSPDRQPERAGERPGQPESASPDSGQSGASAAGGPADATPDAKAGAAERSGDESASMAGAESAPETDATDGNAMVAGTEDETRSSEDAAVEQWLRRIPDDPSGLLRRKFEYESRQRANEGVAPYDPEQPLW